MPSVSVGPCQGCKFDASFSTCLLLEGECFILWYLFLDLPVPPLIIEGCQWHPRVVMPGQSAIIRRFDGSEGALPTHPRPLGLALLIAILPWS